MVSGFSSRRQAAARSPEGSLRMRLMQAMA